MSTSKFQDIRAALNSLISSRFTTDGISGVVITNYRPGGNVTREDRVWIGRIRADQETLTMGGSSGTLGEDLEIDLHIRTPNATGFDDTTQGEAEARAEAILASIETAIRNDDTIGSTVMHAELDSFESTPDADELGPIGTIEALITCSANL